RGRNRKSESVHVDRLDDARLQSAGRGRDGVSRTARRRNHAETFPGAIQGKGVIGCPLAQSRHRRDYRRDVVRAGHESRRAQGALSPGARLQMRRTVVATTLALVAGLVTAPTWARGAGVHAVRYLMGTWCDLVIFDPQPRRDVAESVFQEMARLEHVLSSWDSS